MRVFVTGASGAIGSFLVPQLIERGHEVVGTHHSPRGAERLLAMGAKPVAVDLLDAAAVRRAVLEAEPDAIAHEATALSNVSDLRNFDRTFAVTNQLRTKGTDALLEAAREAGVERFVAQSNVTLRNARGLDMLTTEDEPLDPNPIPTMRESLGAMRHLDEAVSAAGGVALRYGTFYGADNDGLIEPVLKRQFPIVGGGTGVSSFIHLEDAASATVLALESNRSGIYNIVDDDPAPASVWLPALAETLGAKPPRRVPRWLARLFAGEAVVLLSTENRGASNEKAKRELGWTLRYPSWREGFVAAYAGIGPGPDGSRPGDRARSSERLLPQQ